MEWMSKSIYHLSKGEGVRRELLGLPAGEAKPYRAPGPVPTDILRQLYMECRLLESRTGRPTRCERR